MITRLTDIERTLLSAYRDGELSDTEKAAAEKLLAASSDAREYLSDLRSLNEISRAMFPSSPAGGTDTGFGSNITGAAIQSAARTGRGAFGRGRSAIGAGAVAVAIIAFVTFATYRGDGPKETTSTPVASL